MPTRSPDIREVLRLHRESILRDLRVAFPATVERYDSSTQLVDVKPLLTDWFTEDDDSVSQVEIPVITNVPVVFPGAGGYRLTFPVAVGDTVQVLVNDRSLDAWLSQGGAQAPSDLRRHDLTDAVAIPGLHSNNAAWTGARSDGATFGQDGGLQVAVTGTDIELGGTDDAVAMAAKVLSLFNALKGAFTGWTPVPNDGGAALKTALTTLFTTWPSSVASTTVKVKG